MVSYDVSLFSPERSKFENDGSVMHAIRFGAQISWNLDATLDELVPAAGTWIPCPIGAELPA